MSWLRRRRTRSEIRRALLDLEAARAEMARVFVTSGACFAGYPTVGRKTVTLSGTRGNVIATVRLDAITAVFRCFTVNPPTASSLR